VFQGVGNAVDKTAENTNGLYETMGKINADPAVQLQQAFTNMKKAMEPVLTDIAEIVNNIATWISENPKLAATIAVIASTIGILVGAAMGLAPIFIAISTAAGALGVSIGAIAAPIAIAVAAISAIIAIGVLLYKNWDTIKSKAAELKKNLDEKWESIKSSVVNKIQNLKDGTVSRFESLVSSARSKFDAVKSNITEPIEKAKTKVEEVVGKIKSFFDNLKLKIPSPSLPKLPKFELEFSTKTIFGKEFKYPSGFDITWHKIGGVFKKPVIFGNAGFGDVEEAIVPFEGPHARRIAGLIAREMGNYLPTQQAAGEIRIEVPVVLDGREIARSTYRYTNEFIQFNKERNGRF
jgi:ElaB/YqjD/DUF883 family membrane-anchored ribosome-binding protein